MKQKVLKALESIRPGLQAEGGDISLVEIRPDNVVIIELANTCKGCPLAGITLIQAISRIVRMQVPEVTAVQIA